MQPISILETVKSWQTKAIKSTGDKEAANA